MTHPIRYIPFFLFFALLFPLLFFLTLAVIQLDVSIPRQPSHNPAWGQENAITSRTLGGPDRTFLKVKGVSGKAAPNIFQKRYVFYRGNMNKASEVRRLIGIMKRAARVGYNGIVLGGGEYLRLENQPATYFSNFKKLKDTAQELGLVLIPYSMKQSDPTTKIADLAEALPVNGTKFIVDDRVAVPKADPPVGLKNPGFESFTWNQPTGWQIANSGAVMGIDRFIRHSGNASIRIQDPDGKKVRLRQVLSVKPFRAYEFSVWLKTQSFSDLDKKGLKLVVEGIDGQKMLYRMAPWGMGAPVAPTQDWKKYVIDFNSLDNTRVRIAFGAFADKDRKRTGKVWFDDAAIREVGLYQIVRRSSLPVVVTSWDGSTTYREGLDYEVKDQKLEIPPSSTIPDGAVLKVSWYQRGDMVPFGVPASACNEQYFSILRSQAERLNNLFSSPPGFFMRYNEWRVANWDPSCGALTGGKYMANVLRRSENLLRSVNPNYEIYVWSDMLDPYHNARPKYWLVKGSLEGTWQGVPLRTVIVNWGLRKDEKASLIFFSNKGYRQIIGGYYKSLNNVEEWLDAIDEVEAKGVQGIVGFMYTTWQQTPSGLGRYDDLERVADLIRQRGRWGTGPAFPNRTKK